MNYSRQILQILEQNEAVSIEDIVNCLHISERTIRNTISLLREDGKQFGFEISTIHGKGYSLHIFSTALYAKYIKEYCSDRYSDKSERITKILEMIFMRHNGYITVNEIASVLGVSRKTILNDLKTVREELENKQLELYTKSHYGIKVVGDEIKIRAVISDLLNKNMDLHDHSIEYFEFAEKVDKEELKKKYYEIVNRYKLSINDTSMNAIVLHTLIMIYRIQQKNTIHEIHINHEMIADEYFKAAEEMMSYVEQKFAIKTQKQETELMASQLFGKCEYKGSENCCNEDLKISIQQTLQEMDAEYGTDFAEDSLLVEGLMLHVYPLRLRAASGLELNNSLVSAVSAQYMNAFIMSMRFIEKNPVLNQYSFSRDEIGYIAFHFATHDERKMQLILENVHRIVLVIDSVRSDVSLIKVKIKQVFPNATLRVVEGSQVTPEGLAEADLSITTLKHAKGILKTAVSIPQFLDEHDLWTLRNRAIYYIQAKTEEMPELTGLFSEKLFFIENERMTYREILKKYSNIIYKDGYATNEYPDSVIERENKFSTIYDNGIAAPHGLRETSLKDCIAVIVLKKPIDDEGKRCQCILMINVSEKHTFIYQEIGDFLIKVITNVQISKEICRSKTFEEFKLYAKQSM